MEKDLEKITHRVSDARRDDGLQIKVSGNNKHLHVLKDDGTTSLIAQLVADTK